MTERQRRHARIADAALKLFLSQGYSDTTIDQIAEAANVSRRTVFHHFATKDAMLFDHLAPNREVLIRRLEEQPVSEPPLLSLHSVLREMCSEGHDRRLLAQIRTVIAREPRTSGTHLWGGTQEFQKLATEALIARYGDRYSPLQISAIARMALGWYLTAAHYYLIEDRPSLLECFDEVVGACVRSVSQDLG